MTRFMYLINENNRSERTGHSSFFYERRSERVGEAPVYQVHQYAVPRGQPGNRCFYRVPAMVAGQGRAL